MDQLHHVIDKNLANRPHLAGTELQFLRREIGLPQAKLTELPGSTEQTVPLWERGHCMPKAYGRLIRAIYLKSFDRNVKIREMIDWLIDPHNTDYGRIVFEDTGSGWRKAT
ncbi:transcriptional regulator [Castellaniella sp.]|uniref:transcriptional regulator n=1 Tax=Castellaniella sp. TaxID=1955812 RepID=UPI002AFEB8BC|nr:transcriptional regulator [Castellaniella sp.]